MRPTYGLLLLKDHGAACCSKRPDRTRESFAQLTLALHVTSQRKRSKNSKAQRKHRESTVAVTRHLVAMTIAEVCEVTQDVQDMEQQVMHFQT